MKFWRPFIFLLVLIGTATGIVIERPVPEGGGPTIVTGWMGIADVDSISDADQNFTIKLYSEFSWLDPREKHDGDGLVVKPLSEIWYPDFSFLNMQRTWGESAKEVTIAPSGRVLLQEHRWGNFSQPLNLRKFPFDSQRFEVRAVSGESIDHVVFYEAPDDKSYILDSSSVADWRITDPMTDTTPFGLPGRLHSPSFALSFTGTRLSDHYVFKVISPLVLIIAVSWIVFWLDPKEGGSQLSVAVTSFLTVIAYHISLGSNIPKIPYLTRLDVFVFGGTILVFLAVLEVVITTNCARRNQLDRARSIDKTCRIFFPVTMLSLSIYAFCFH